MPEFLTRLNSALGDGYVIERELGGGGMSRVFVAVERALQRKVVIKVLPPDLSVGVNIERFRREIQLAAQLQHPHIVPLLSASNDRELLWFTMPFIEGSSLRRTLDKDKQLSPRDVVRILHDVVDALAYAHARGVVHRDIKPDNILTSGMHAMVTDFGVAKALSAAIPVAGGTTTGMAIGTPAYMAPEQLAADPAADHRVDIYAVGLLAYELLTGEAPFKGASPQATLAAQLTKMPEAPHVLSPAIPEALSDIVMRCLEKDASRRFQSATELLGALDALPPLTGSVVGSTRPKVRTSRRTTYAVAAIALIAATAGALYVSGMDESGDSRAVSSRADSAARAADSSRASGLADTSVVARSIPLDGTRPTSVPVVITRAESLAIAEAIRKRSTPTPAAASGAASSAPNPDATSRDAAAAAAKAVGSASGTGTSHRVFVNAAPGTEYRIEREELLAEVRRIFSDSLKIAMGKVDSTMAHLPRIMRMEDIKPGLTTIVPIVAPPADDETRVVVTPFINRSRAMSLLNPFGAQVADSLRAVLSRKDKVDVPTRELTGVASAGSDRLAAGGRLRADYVVSGEYHVRGDSLLVIARFSDVRSGHFNRGAQFTVPASDPTPLLGTLASRVSAWVDTARTMASHRPRQSFRPMPPAEGRRGRQAPPPAPTRPPPAS